MAPERRRLAILLSLLAIAVVIAAIRFWPESAAGGTASPAGTAVARRGGTTSRVTAPDVHLPALGQDRPHPETAGGRDLFRFKPKAPPPSPEASARPPVAAAAPSGPPPPPPIAPIALRFIGLVEAPGQSQRIAVLSDSRGIYQGREGDIIEGRYRILHIGVESIDMAYVDGTGRQTIRLSGS